METNSNRMKVVIRVRPFIREDLDCRSQSPHSRSPRPRESRPQLETCIRCDDESTLSLFKPMIDDRQFYFDSIINTQGTQEDTYEVVGSKIVNDVLNGFNGTVMAYGQTGSGKTYSIFGSRRSLNGYTEGYHPEMGIVPRSIQHLFHYIKENPNNAQFQVTVSFLQIYLETITDLLDPSSKNLQIREDPKTGIFVMGLTQKTVRKKTDLLKLIKESVRNRMTSPTSMNKTSSRSHAILQVYVEQRYIKYESPEPETDEDSRQVKKRFQKKGLLTIVDLAGSERLSKTASEGLRLEEAKKINKSISALGNCVAALATEGNIAHVPFRDSKLTRLLTDSLGGNAKTALCVCVSPSVTQYEESYNALMFASRAKIVKINPRLNEVVDFKFIGQSDAGNVSPHSMFSNFDGSQFNTDAGSDFDHSSRNRSPSPNSMVYKRGGGENSPIGVRSMSSNSSFWQGSYQSPEYAGPHGRLNSYGGLPQNGAQRPQHLRSTQSMYVQQNQDGNDVPQWEDREKEMATKFNNVINHLQIEIAKQNILISKLKQDNEELVNLANLNVSNESRNPAIMDDFLDRLLATPGMREKIQGRYFE